MAHDAILIGNLSDITTQPLIFSTSTEWRSWLIEETGRFLRVYEQDPRRIASDRGAERSASTAYHGREILELLQNANDAAAENGTNSHVRIELSPSGLVVANTGRPFQAGGITSLMLAHLSTKSRDSLVIGNKGLGFRAVLNWTQRPIVLSGALALGFGPEIAREHEARIQHVLERITEHRAGGLPTLQFPAILDNIPEGLPAAWREIFAACQRCRTSFDTAIGLVFERPGSYEQAREQILALSPEMLLFVRHLDRLEIALPGESVKAWHIRRTGNEAQVKADGIHVRTWKIWAEDGDLPLELVEPESPHRYELAIATSDTPLQGRKLYSYFETQVDFGFPLICHASFELDPTRNHINQGALNLFIMRRLAELHARVVEEVARAEGGWSGGKLAVSSRATELFPGGDYQSELMRALQDKAFLPCVDGKMRRGSEARNIVNGSSSWLPPSFGDAVNFDGFSGASTLLKVLDVHQLTEEEWMGRIDLIDFSAVETVARFAAGLLKSGLLASFSCLPNILTDSSGERIQGGRIYVSGSSGTEPSPPHWLSFRFLNSPLRERLQRHMSEKDGRDLVSRLKASGYDADEYNTASVTGAAVSQAESYIAANPDKTDNVRHELLAYLHKIFLARSSESEFRPIARLQVPNQVGSWTPALEVHFSTGHTEHGEILQVLYGNCLPQLLVAPASEFPWIQAPASLAAFLAWIGVADLPRSCTETIDQNEFTAYVKSQIPPTFRVIGENHVYTHQSISHRRHVDASSIVGLDKILDTATPEAVLGWVAKDGRFGDWMSASKSHGKFVFIKPGGSASKTYDGEIPSYPRWLIQHTTWLTGDDGQKHAPCDMVLSEEEQLAGIIPRPRVPAGDKLSSDAISSALHLVGLPRGIASLSLRAYFDALRRCEAVDHKAAASYYRYVLEQRKSNGDSTLIESQERRNFIATGKVWCDYGGTVQLIEVKRARYRKGDDVPKGISQFVPLMTFPPKRGPDRVDALFGVRVLKDSGFEILNTVPRAGSENVQEQVSAAAESMLLLRRATLAPSKLQIEALTNLKVEVCSEVSAAFVGDDSSRQEVHMGENEWILTSGNRALYVVCPDSQPVSLRNECLVNSIAEAIASIFGLTDPSAFARLIQAADETQRIGLLSSLLGEAPADVLEQLARMREREQEIAKQGGPIVPPLPPPPLPTVPKLPEGEPVKPEPSGDLTGGSTGKGIGDNSVVTVQPLPHTPEVRKRIRTRVTHSAPKEKGFKLSYRSPASGVEAERVALAYERSKGRHPVSVNHIQGQDGSGCDILSYRTPEEAEAVRAMVEKAPFATVERVIEVKGRSDQSARISLAGNELDAANLRKERYFLYRIFRTDEPDTWQIAELQNPCHATESHVPTLVVDLEAAQNTKKAVLTLADEGIDEIASDNAPAASQPVTAADTLTPTP
ncbi:MAG: DUF3883 domain-containing protein [Verrucomicrobiae bacterium]